VQGNHVQRALLAALAAVCLTQIGCTTAIKQAYYELRGASANVLLNELIPPSALEPFDSVRFEPVTTSLTARLVPRKLLTEYDRFAANAPTQLADCFPGSTRTLVVASDVLYFQEKGLLSPAMMLTRVHLRDGGRVVADTVVRVESKAFRDGGEDDIAEAAIRGLSKFLREQRGCAEPGKEDGKKDRKAAKSSATDEPTESTRAE